MSVETISTKESESKSSNLRAPYRPSTVSRGKPERKRRISSRSEDSFTSDDEVSCQREGRRASSRSTRRRIGDLSPPERGRRRSRTRSRERRSTYSNDEEYRGRTKLKPKLISVTSTYDGDTSTRLNCRSPQLQGEWRHSSTSGEPRRNYRDDSRSRSHDSYPRTYPTDQQKGEIRFSDIESARHMRDHSARRASLRRQPCVEANVQRNKTTRESDCCTTNMPRGRTSGRAVQRERSPSPFSKRLALTQAMNMGR
jgi:hypothetical protein